MVSSGTDGIVLVSADPNQVANQLTEAFDADIPVFGCDSGFIDGMQVNATSDNYQMGELIVRYLFDDLMGGKGTVIALTHRPHPGVVKRCEAFDDIIKEYPDIQLITEQHVPAEQPINDAEEITANLLTANPDKDSVTAISQHGMNRPSAPQRHWQKQDVTKLLLPVLTEMSRQYR